MKEYVKVVMMHYCPQKKIQVLENSVNLYPYSVPSNRYEEETREGEWLVLAKEENVFVTVKSEKHGPAGVDMKSQICDFYKREMSQELFSRFCEDVRNETVKIYVADDGNLKIE